MSLYKVLFFSCILWQPVSRADTDLTCIPERPEIQGPVFTNSVYTKINIGPYSNELNFSSSTIPASVDLTVLKNEIQRSFTSSAWVDFKNGVRFSAIDYSPGTYTFKTGTYGTGYILDIRNNQAAITIPAGTGTLSVDTWVTMQPKSFNVKLPAMLNGSFSVQTTGLLGYFFVYNGATLDKRFDANITYNCTATSQPQLSVSPVLIDFGTIAALPGAPVVERELTVTVPQAGVSSQVGIELISSAVIDQTKVPLGLSWFEVINPANNTAVPVSATPGQNGLRLTQDDTKFTLRLHPVVGSDGQSSTSLTINVVWI